MRRSCLVLALLAPLAPIAPASAADLIYTPPSDEVLYAPTSFTWTGFQLGFHGGYSWGETDSDAADISPFIAPLASFDIDGGSFGVHGGYNYQYGAWVFGGEADLDWSGIEGDAYAPAADSTADFEVDWKGSLRGRIGYAFDRLLVYATGGLAFASTELTVNGPLTGYDDESDSNTHVGWTLGAGVDYAFTDQIIGRVEYRYTDYGSEDYSSSIGTVSGDFTTSEILAGVSYKF